MAGRDLLGVVECKDLAGRVGSPAVDAFITKSREVRANIAILASRRGFTKPALEQARMHGIGTVSLNSPAPDVSVGFQVGVCAFATRYRWTKSRVKVHSPQPIQLGHPLVATEISLDGESVFDWFQKELVKSHLREPRVGWHRIAVSFYALHELNCSGVPILTDSIRFEALREREVRSKWLPMFGDAVVDWSASDGATARMTLPPGATLTSATIDTQLEDWLVHDGDPPPMNREVFDMRLEFNVLHCDPESTTIDLEQYGTVRYGLAS